MGPSEANIRESCGFFHLTRDVARLCFFRKVILVSYQICKQNYSVDTLSIGFHNCGSRYIAVLCKRDMKYNSKG